MTKDETLKELIEDLISAMEYHVEQTRQIHSTTVALQAARETLKSLTRQRTEQEPVGWLDSDDKLAEFMHKDLKAEHDKRDSSTPRYFQIPVYTTPPQRKPLTNEEIYKIYRDCGDLNVKINIARAIEAAHGIKE